MMSLLGLYMENHLIFFSKTYICEMLETLSESNMRFKFLSYQVVHRIGSFMYKYVEIFILNLN